MTDQRRLTPRTDHVLADPRLREALTPTEPIGCKRMLFSNQWYPALAQPNVDVVTDTVSEVVPEGETEAGAPDDVDTLAVPMAELRPALEAAWGDPAERRAVRFPVYAAAG